jgi:F-type H+-transporting ATPase subunit a
MTRGRLLVAIGLVLAVNVLAFIFVPPFPPGDPEGEFEFPGDAIAANYHLPEPYVVIGDNGNGAIVQFNPSITDSLLTSWILIVLLTVLVFAVTRRWDQVPGRVQNVVEWIYEALRNFAVGLGGPKAERYVPLFAGLFLFILACNWSGLIPVVGRVDGLRAPTSDVNIPIGLALVSFSVFHIEGFRRLGPRGYLGKFFPVGEFRNGIAAGGIAMFVGLIELMLEFVKPLTLSMRLFGNIFGGEVALGVITALTIAIIPVALVGLEFLLNFVQALIFATLTLMFTLAAIEGHHEEGHEEHAEEPKAPPVPHPTLERSATG